MATQPPPQTPPDAAPPPTRRKRWPWVVLAFVIFFIGYSVGVGGEETPTTPVAAEPAPTVTVTATPVQATPGPTVTVTHDVPGPTKTVRVTVKAKPPAPASSIPGDGVFLVGEDIEAGTYRTSNPEGFCYWARLKATDGDFDSIITNSAETGPATVTIKSSDVAFETTGCGDWTAR